MRIFMPILPSLAPDSISPFIPRTFRPIRSFGTSDNCEKCLSVFLYSFVHDKFEIFFFVSDPHRANII